MPVQYYVRENKLTAPPLYNLFDRGLSLVYDRKF